MSDLILPLISPLISAVSLIVALLALWFSQLKGPDIELCNTPSAELKDWDDDQLNISLQSRRLPWVMPLEPIQLVLINNGSRGGAVTSIVQRFEPSERLKAFGKGAYPSVHVGEENLPLSIENGGTCVAELSFSIVTPQWGSDFRYEDFPDISNLKDAFEKSIALDKSQFVAFVKLIKAGESLGHLSISMTYSTRRLLGGAKMITKEVARVEVKNNCKILSEGIVRFPAFWNDTSLLHGLFGKALNSLGDLVERLSRINQSLSKELEEGYTRPEHLGDYWVGLGRSEIVKRIIFERESGLKEKLLQIDKQIVDYDSRLSLLIEANRRPIQDLSGQTKTLNEQRIKLLMDVGTVQSEVQQLRTRLVKELQE